ncbi:hypothetical protein C1Y63_00290 [Corynebacterium sp. 13CS0277]|uniref:hypothetical protein n=1 Tax=Corynebacterium sp. 13CS0277 TaxID=2071994 RepID=UPI000D03F085|nr:hypothetical protein [Corynebacterium sp. 13CS0277]PRQ12537.1 hypothetical protein C1Y63_00290 [Corynebacterium sp. 13CS0277]
MNPGDTSPIADPTDSLLGWASNTEIALQQTFAGVSYVSDARLANDTCELYERFLGIFVSRQLAAGGDFSALLRLVPALFSAVLTYRAGRLVDPHQFGAEVLAGLGVSAEAAGAEAEQQVVELAPELLASAGLVAEFAPEPDPEVLPWQVALLGEHAGLIDCDVPDVVELFDLLTPGEHTADDRAEKALEVLLGGDAAGVFGEDHEERLARPLTVAVACAAANPERMRGLLLPLAEVYGFSLAHPDEPLRGADDAMAALPPTVAYAAAAELKERPAGTPGRRFAVGTATREIAPRIIFDEVRSKVCLRLPELPLRSAAEQRSWRVRVDGTTTVYRTGKPWGEVNLLSQAIDVPIARQVREVTVVDADTGSQWVVPVVADHDDPAMIFSVKGQNLSDKRSLHHGRVRVVAPAGSTVWDVVHGTELDTFERAAVGGWDGWEALTVDCEEAVSLQVVPPQGKPSLANPVRSVDARRRVRFVDPGSPIDGLRSVTRLPLHSASLIAEFPPTVTGEEETWFLTISSFAGAGNSGEEVAPAEPLLVPAEGGVFDIFDPGLYDAPWVGEYLVRLRGPRNESFRHEYAIVEGLDASYETAGLSTSFRIPAQGGLSEAVLKVRSGDKPFHVTPKNVVVVGDAPGAEFTVATEEGDQMPIWFKPPRLRFDIPLLGQPTRWRTTRMVTSTRSFDPEGMVRVRVVGKPGALKQAQISVRNHHGTPLRTVKMTAEDPVTMVAPFASLAQAMGSMVSGRLDVEWTDTRADKRVSVNLATITNVPAATGAALSADGTQILLEDVAEDRALGAWLWPLTAPWAPGVRVPVVGGVIDLPENLRGAGDISVQLHTADPFSSMRAPLVPGPGSFLVAQDGFYGDADPAKSHLAEFFAGLTDTVPDDKALWPLLWDFVTGHEAAGQTATLAIGALAANPRGALTGLSASEVPADQQPGQLIRTGLVTADFARAAGDGAGESMHRTAWIAALEQLADLPALVTPPAPAAEDAAPSTEEDAVADAVAAALGVEDGDAAEAAAEPWALDPKQVRAALAQVAAVAGDRLVETIRTGRDATLESACIDASTVAIAKMPPEQQAAVLEMFFSQSHIVPGPIMDDSARLLAVFEAFNQREAVSALLGDSELIQSAVSLLRAMRGANRHLFSVARIRFDKLDGVDTDSPDARWALAPVISIVFALSARMHAHGIMGKSKVLAAATQGWAKLAELVPDLVTGDLIAAEAMVLSVLHPELTD